jgi:hypothetical protein
LATSLVKGSDGTIDFGSAIEVSASGFGAECLGWVDYVVPTNVNLAQVDDLFFCGIYMP